MVSMMYDDKGMKIYQTITIKNITDWGVLVYATKAYNNLIPIIWRYLRKEGVTN